MELKPRPSLLAQHRKILGYDQSPLTADDLAEKERIERLPLRPLDLTNQPAKSGDWWLSLTRPKLIFPVLSVAFAALVAFIFVGPEQGGDDTLRFKGESKVWMYFERSGVAGRVTPDTVLQNGDRVRAEILAADDGVAYLAIMNQAGELLSPPDLVLGRALVLEAGRTKAFEGSIELVGANEGETVVVMICREPLDQALLKEYVARKNEPLVRNNLPGACAVETIKLR